MVNCVTCDFNGEHWITGLDLRLTLGDVDVNTPSLQQTDFGTIRSAESHGMSDGTQEVVHLQHPHLADGQNTCWSNCWASANVRRSEWLDDEMLDDIL
jgi:hypothetical protein